MSLCALPGLAGACIFEFFPSFFWFPFFLKCLVARWFSSGQLAPKRLFQRPSPCRSLRTLNAIVILPEGHKLSQLAQSQTLLAAMSAGVPLVSSKWIADMSRRSRELPMERYLLNQPSNELVLDEMRIELVGTAEFRAKWGRVVREAGGKVVDRLLVAPEGRVDLVVSEEDAVSPNELVVNESKRRNVPVVTVQWLKDTIVTGIVREDHGSLEKYQARRRRAQVDVQ